MATDDFNRADAGDLGAGWTVHFRAGLGIISNEAAGPSSPGGFFDDYTAFINGTFAAAQSAEALITSHGSVNSRSVGLTLLCSGTGASADGYVFYLQSNGAAYIFRIDDGVWSLVTGGSLGSTGVGNGYSIRFVTDGAGTFQVFYNDNGVSGWVQIGSDVTGETTYTSGNPGINAGNNTGATAAALDDFIATGDSGGGGGSDQPMMRRWGGRSGPVPGIGQSSGGGKAWG